MTDTDIGTDICIIGGGPGGLAAATALALHGRAVTVVNGGPLMGYGIEGAFKSKAEFEITRQYVYASLRPEVFGSTPPPKFENVLRGTEKSASSLNASVLDRMQRLGVKMITGHARFIDPHTVVVGGQELKASKFIIATGSRPRIPKGLTADNDRIMSSDTVNLRAGLPESILILGAGVIGCEYASIFAALGSRVTLLDTQDRVLSMEDPDVSAFVERAFRQRNITVVPGTRFDAVEPTKTGVRTTFSDGRTLETAAVLLAVGRTPCTGDLGLEIAGVARDERGNIPTSDCMQTNVEHIYAVGDVGLRDSPVDMALVHVAQAEGRCAAHHILGEQFNQNIEHVPYIIFTIPMVAGAGLSETAARERFGPDIRVGKYPYGRNHRAHTMYPPLGFVKLIVGPPGDDRMLGVRVVGRDADTLVAAASIMIEQQLSYSYLMESILPHPSLMECLQGAAHIIAGDALSYEAGEEYDFGSLAIERPD
ncbi:MAG: NAD(P)/FAD-dependent oxidoreductase [Gammaproteobacteria bacterium]|nr:NAD(P)/FAD-dependent oxidoreductase [Gammaproteobacteria bacterium]